MLEDNRMIKYAVLEELHLNKSIYNKCKKGRKRPKYNQRKNLI